MGECGLHPLIHTLLKFNLAQDVEGCQRFAGFGNELPQTGQTFSLGLIIRLALHLGHLTGWSFIRLISLGFTVLALFYLRRKKRKQMKTIITSEMMIRFNGSEKISKTPFLYRK
jgi:hypothetical protein